MTDNFVFYICKVSRECRACLYPINIYGDVNDVRDTIWQVISIIY